MVFIWHACFALLYCTASLTQSELEKHRSARQDGDIILGGLFPVHRPPHNTSRYTRSCGEIWEQYGIHRTEVFLLTLDSINNNPDILPNVTLGWDVRDSCWYSPIALEQSIDFIRTTIASIDAGKYNDSVPGCGNKVLEKPIAGLVGPGSSQNTIQVQNMLQMFHIPQIGFSATSMDLSDKNLYKYFVRVVPSDTYQAQAMLDVVIRYGWTYISAVHSEGNYGERGIDEFTKLAKSRNICIANTETAPNDDDIEGFDKIVTNLLETPRARVVVCFCEGMAVRRLMMASKRVKKALGFFQILASDGWADRPDVVAGIEEAAVGGVSMKLMSDPIPSFDSYFRSLRPKNNTRNPWFREFWQWKFKCNLPNMTAEEQDKRYKKPCTGDEQINGLVQDAKLGFVIQAVYALAYALHNMHSDLCAGVSGVCDRMVPVVGTRFLDYLLNVSFSYNNESIFFDASGDPPPRYYIVNYQKFVARNGNVTYKYRRIGTWNSGKLAMDDEHMEWPQQNHGRQTISICSDDCHKGYVKKKHGNIACCWVCAQCRENEFITTNDTCEPCSIGWWPNTNLTACFRIRIEYITWWDTEAMIALISACIGMFITVWVGMVFIRHNNTPVVKASTRELSYIILLGVMIAYCSNFVLVAKPSLITCYFTRILPGMSFSLIYGALVTKTNRIARILEGTKKIITKKPRFMSASAQVVITCLLIGVECAIITIMLVVEPADSKLDYPTTRRVKLVCNTTTMGIIVPLGFDFVLIIMCTLYAVKTRNLPENFNEAKFIGFSMYTTCVIWLGFMAIYFGSEWRVITMSVSISLSATVALVLLFFPKVYIIIWAPEKNTRSAFTTSKDLRCHIGSISCASGESLDLIREKKQIELLQRTGQRRPSLLQRFRNGGTSIQRRKNNNKSFPKSKRDMTIKMRREDSFHIDAALAKDAKAKYSWARMAARGMSDEDRLSTISSKDGSDEQKSKHVTFERRECGCQTDAELLKSILHMPYLRRRHSQRIQRATAIDDDYTSAKFSPNNSMKVRYSRRTSSGSTESGKTSDPKRRKGTSSLQPISREKKVYLYPGYSDSPQSTSDDIENEEDFEYYDSITDLIKAHPLTPLSYICVNDTSMSTYLNPLGNHSSMKKASDTEAETTFHHNNSAGSADECLQLIVENGIDGPNTIVIKEPLTKSSSYPTQSRKTCKISSCFLPPPVGSSFTNGTGALEVCMKGRQRPVSPIRRASSPATSYISSQSFYSNDEDERRARALSRASFCSTKDSSVQSFVSSKSADDVTTAFVHAVDTEENSMVEFQSFLRERGVELDISHVESSEV